MSDMRLVDITPIVNGWNDAVKEKLEEAKALLASWNYPDYNKGVVKEEVANLISGLADDLMSAPVIDPETLRPVASWVKGEDIMSEYYACSRCEHKVRDRFGTSSYCPHCGARMEEEK